MNAFFKTFFASLLAFVVGGIFFVVLGVMFVVGIGLSAVSSGVDASSVSTPSSHSILKIDLSVPIVDNPVQERISSLERLTMGSGFEMPMLNVLGAIQRAKADKHIDGIYLNINPAASIGLATMEELRNALLDFKDGSDKFIIAYSDFYTQKSYYLSSVADRIYMNPQGSLLWKGMASNVIFYKGLLDKLGVQPEVVRHGAYKSAVEPFIMDKMSPENRLQTEKLIGTIWNHVVSQVAQARSIDSAALQRYASELTINDAEQAVAKGLVDSLAYGADMDSLLAGMTDQETPNYYAFEDYVAQSVAVNKSDNLIAVVYADGEIVDGDAPQPMVGGETLAAKLAELRDQDEVKGVVLRVNSPGGSALASEVIWHEMELLRNKKPVIVSMGDMAASGGYYISCPADAILASPTTITGSIGVFGLLFNAQNGLKDKLGITVDVAKTNPSADLGVPFRTLSDAERNYLQHSVEHTYTQFVDHVASGRNLTREQVDSLGGGRVWSGVSALGNGLIDSYGGLLEAIALAADRAGVGEDFSISAPSNTPDLLTRILFMLTSQTAVKEPFQGELGMLYRDYATLQRILSREGVQALLPCRYDIQ